MIFYQHPRVDQLKDWERRELELLWKELGYDRYAQFDLNSNRIYFPVDYDWSEHNMRERFNYLCRKSIGDQIRE